MCVFARYMGLILCIELPACLPVVVVVAVVAARLANIFIQFLISFTFFFCPSHCAHCQHTAHSVNACVCYLLCAVATIADAATAWPRIFFIGCGCYLAQVASLTFPWPSAAATLLQCADLLIRHSTRRCRHTVVIEKLSEADEQPKSCNS